MPERVALTINGKRYEALEGTTVAAAIMNAGATCRTSVARQARGPLCGMGICFECRATVNGKPHQRTCQMICENGMEVETQ
ncbi:(2Fe-2S)-binding protein [Pseudacidobacterium ailaaui]|jgi:sarcosine oxidase subunit alpha|uniref:(2Fe-2S)-binding protein n=1 Tax=Pseudacidobacterium ailaaui TaxID=1382359 RepID=UPI000478E299|nr:(2Fe-2S)-binding protein [Pseudacidobacterium ailaaui]MDI3254778.1 (2Fe-2S)-binding protein [Bacillota bacterium]